MTRGRWRTHASATGLRLAILIVLVLAVFLVLMRRSYTLHHPARCSCAEWKPCNASTTVAHSARCSAKRKHVLIVHEQHPQPLGCDRRLLSLVAMMQANGWHVSLFYRRHARVEQQSPRTAELATQLGVRDFDASQHLDGGCLRSPPAIYRFAGRGKQLARLAQQGWFDLVLLSVWFWNEPDPAFAEIALPLLRAHTPAQRAPFVGLLIDDAHALRAARLAEWESEPSVKATYEAQARALTPRLHALYALSDTVLHVSLADQREERSAYASALPPSLRWQLLRTPLKSMRTQSERILRRAKPPALARLGFLGNGQTATNHQGVQWFLQNCWASLRAKSPQLRLRLVGRTPGITYNTSGVYPCDRHDSHKRCGWAWGTPFAGAEAQNGIDELGFLGSNEMVEEALMWRAMVAPIRATTGINTKLLVGLELGIPIVVTPAAAAPLALAPPTPTRLLTRNASAAAVLTPAALLAADPVGFVAHCHRLLMNDHIWRASSRAALEAHARMEQADPAGGDMRALLAAACAGRGHAAGGVHVEAEVEASAVDMPAVGGGLCDVVDVAAAACG